MFRHLAPGPN